MIQGITKQFLLTRWSGEMNIKASLFYRRSSAFIGG